MPVDGYDATQFRVQQRAVITLGIVLPVDLPVAGEPLRLAADGHHLRERPLLEDRGIPAEVGREFTGRLGQRDEDESSPFGHVRCVQHVVVEAEIRRLDAYRRRDEPAVQVVRPRVVRTDDATVGEASARDRAQRRAAMPAGVVKRLDRAVGRASDDQPLLADLGDEVVAGSRDLFGTTDRDPIAVPDSSSARDDSDRDRSTTPRADRLPCGAVRSRARCSRRVSAAAVRRRAPRLRTGRSGDRWRYRRIPLRTSAVRTGSAP